MSDHDPFDLRGQERDAVDTELQTRLDLELEESDTKGLMSSAM